MSLEGFAVRIDRFRQLLPRDASLAERLVDCLENGQVRCTHGLANRLPVEIDIALDRDMPKDPARVVQVAKRFARRALHAAILPASIRTINVLDVIHLTCQRPRPELHLDAVTRATLSKVEC